MESETTTFDKCRNGLNSELPHRKYSNYPYMDQSVPPGRVRGICIPPCSKSYAQRALAASLLAEGTSRLHNIEFCDDTRSAIRCIEALGARVRRTGERTLEIDGGLSPAGDKLYVASRGFPPGSSPRSHPSATRRSEWWAKDRCCTARSGR